MCGGTHAGRELCPAQSNLEHEHVRGTTAKRKRWTTTHKVPPCHPPTNGFDRTTLHITTPTDQKKRIVRDERKCVRVQRCEPLTIRAAEDIRVERGGPLLKRDTRGIRDADDLGGRGDRGRDEGAQSDARGEHPSRVCASGGVECVSRREQMQCVSLLCRCGHGCGSESSMVNVTWDEADERVRRWMLANTHQGGTRSNG
jgi:hypothetical protein